MDAVRGRLTSARKSRGAHSTDRFDNASSWTGATPSSRCHGLPRTGV
jgi:hypothetical protein